jgi:hypothetical protein
MSMPSASRCLDPCAIGFDAAACMSQVGGKLRCCYAWLPPSKRSETCDGPDAGAVEIMGCPDTALALRLCISAANEACFCSNSSLACAPTFYTHKSNVLRDTYHQLHKRMRDPNRTCKERAWVAMTPSYCDKRSRCRWLSARASCKSRCVASKAAVVAANLRAIAEEFIQTVIKFQP